MKGKKVKISVGLHKDKVGTVVRVMMDNVLEVDIGDGYFAYVLITEVEDAV